MLYLISTVIDIWKRKALTQFLLILAQTEQQCKTELIQTNSKFNIQIHLDILLPKSLKALTKNEIISVTLKKTRSYRLVLISASPEESMQFQQKNCITSSCFI